MPYNVTLAHKTRGKNGVLKVARSTLRADSVNLDGPDVYIRQTNMGQPHHKIEDEIAVSMTEATSEKRQIQFSCADSNIEIESVKYTEKPVSEDPAFN